jgi:DNA-binding MarR family transcriptional regulator
VTETISDRPPGTGAKAPGVELGVALADTVFGFQRVTRRAVRQSFSGDVLPPAEAELLAFVGRSKGTGVGEAAHALQLASNTVSTLVGRLVEAGLLERRADPADGRVARLHLTSAGAARVRRWRRHRAEVLAQALDTLDEHERTALAAALAPLRRLAENMENLMPDGNR